MHNWEHPIFANRPQTRSLGLYKRSPPARTRVQPAEAGFVCIAAVSTAKLRFRLDFPNPKICVRLIDS